MLSEQTVMSALVTERKMYTALTELLETTGELSEALSRQDQVSFQLYLGMRHDTLNQLAECKAILKKQCADLPEKEGNALRQILSGEAPQDGGAQRLADQVRRNRELWQKAVLADRLANQRLGGKKSFYAGKRSHI